MSENFVVRKRLRRELIVLGFKAVNWLVPWLAAWFMTAAVPSGEWKPPFIGGFVCVFLWQFVDTVAGLCWRGLKRWRERRQNPSLYDALAAARRHPAIAEGLKARDVPRVVSDMDMTGGLYAVIKLQSPECYVDVLEIEGSDATVTVDGDLSVLTMARHLLAVYDIRFRKY